MFRGIPRNLWLAYCFTDVGCLISRFSRSSDSSDCFCHMAWCGGQYEATSIFSRCMQVPSYFCFYFGFRVVADLCGVIMLVSLLPGSFAYLRPIARSIGPLLCRSFLGLRSLW